ncbi:hypothetical protein FA15DRAFT_659538 [Coprinopsis marcescibilis]|uniref:Uncharacterized protein n=1 Tax=Coprinopsis marcescibilis TaxID=230819 RepID=A0A5C3KJ18_COPMA|nr:hypothetical protein FA15DRAFT_659538 [Coprinopsis marcescibilis]
MSKISWTSTPTTPSYIYGLPPSKPTRNSKRKLYEWFVSASEGMELRSVLSVPKLGKFGAKIGVTALTMIEFTFKDKSVGHADLIATLNLVAVEGEFKLSGATYAGDSSKVLPRWVQYAGPVPHDGW